MEIELQPTSESDRPAGGDSAFPSASSWSLSEGEEDRDDAQWGGPDMDSTPAQGRRGRRVQQDDGPLPQDDDRRFKQPRRGQRHAAGPQPPLYAAGSVEAAVFEAAVRIANEVSPGASHAIFFTVGAALGQAAHCCVICTPCQSEFKVAVRFNADGRVQPVTNADVKTISKHCKNNQHVAECSAWFAARTAPDEAEDGSAASAWAPRSSRRRAAPQGLAAAVQGPGGLRSLLDQVLMRTLSDGGALYDRIQAGVSDATQNRKEAAQLQRSCSARAALWLALCGTEEGVAAGGQCGLNLRSAGAFALAPFVRVVRPLPGGGTHPRPALLLGPEPAPGSTGVAQADVQAFVAALRFGFTALSEVGVLRPPPLRCFGERPSQTLAGYALNRNTLLWLSGLGEVDDMDEEPEAEAAAAATPPARTQPGLGERAGRGQEYANVAKQQRKYLRALELLVQAWWSHVASGGSSSSSTAEGPSTPLPVLVSEFFTEEHGRLRFGAGATVQTALATRAQVLQRHLPALCTLIADLKDQFARWGRLADGLLGAVSRRLVREAAVQVAGRPVEGPADRLGRLADRVLVPVLLHPTVVDVVNTGAVMALVVLLAGSRCGWYLQLASTLLLTDRELSKLHKLKGSLVWDKGGVATLFSAGDKTARFTGSVPYEVPEQALSLLLLAELKLLAVQRRLQLSGSRAEPLWSPPVRQARHTKLHAPALLQDVVERRTRAGALVLVPVPVLPKHRNFFLLMRRGLWCQVGALDVGTPVAWDTWAAALVATGAPLEAWRAAYAGAFGRAGFL